MIIDAPVLTEPRTWNVSKINRVTNKGLVMVTLAQDKFDQNRDFIELNDDGNVIGMWASYWDSSVEPILPSDQESQTSEYSEITYSGVLPQIKVGGSYKKLTVKFYNEIGEIPFKSGVWTFEIDGSDASSVITALSSDSSKDLDENQIKIKFTGDTEYIGKNIIVTYTSTSGIKSSVTMNIVGL